MLAPTSRFKKRRIRKLTAHAAATQLCLVLTLKFFTFWLQGCIIGAILSALMSVVQFVAPMIGPAVQLATTIIPPIMQASQAANQGQQQAPAAPTQGLIPQTQAAPQQVQPLPGANNAQIPSGQQTTAVAQGANPYDTTGAKANNAAKDTEQKKQRQAKALNQRADDLEAIYNTEKAKLQKAIADAESRGEPMSAEEIQEAETALEESKKEPARLREEAKALLK